MRVQFISIHLAFSQLCKSLVEPDQMKTSSLHEKKNSLYSFHYPVTNLYGVPSIRSSCHILELLNPSTDGLWNPKATDKDLHDNRYEYFNTLSDKRSFDTKLSYKKHWGSDWEKPAPPLLDSRGHHVVLSHSSLTHSNPRGFSSDKKAIRDNKTLKKIEDVTINEKEMKN